MRTLSPLRVRGLIPYPRYEAVVLHTLFPSSSFALFFFSRSLEEKQLRRWGTSLALDAST